jgi:sulfate/thiosulfate transport system substrate-binding protein
VLLAWENEALTATQGRTAAQFEIVYPSVTVLAEPPVAIVDKNVDKHGTRAAAEAYVKFLFTEQAQTIAAKHGYRPRSTSAAAAAKVEFAPVETFAVDDLYADGWKTAQSTHFADGGIFDQIQTPKN